MKTQNWILTAIATAALVLAGCSKQGGGSVVDTSAIEKNFKSADASVQASADKVVSAIKGADYSGALAELKSLASNAKLTPEQKQTITDLMGQVEKAVGDAAAKVKDAAKDTANKAAQDVQKALPK